MHASSMLVPMDHHRCHLCHRRYKRLEHLKRHFNSHEPGHTYTCHVCGKNFARSDTLKRHASTCTNSSSFRRRQACDGCVRSKKACDLSHPCQTCLTRNAPCNYPDNLFLNLATASWDEFTDLDPDANLTFLDNFTRCTGLLDSFDCGTQELRINVLRSPVIPYQCDVIVSLIEEVATVKPRNSIVDIEWSDDIRNLCLEFFTSHEIGRKLELYWSIWHPNVNIVHRPTFNNAKPSLVAAMVVLGAAVSPVEEDRLNARRWFNAVEEVVFVDDDFCADDDSITLAKVQSMQAAYIVCLYQNWEGCEKAKRRIRRNRFSTLVSVARDIGIHKARHNTADWRSWVLYEQLVRINLWIFLLDTAFVIFNNLPPRMVIKEMRLDLATCEAAFQADSFESCMGSLKSSRGDLTLSVVADAISHTNISPELLQQLADVGPLNMFVIASSLHSMLFQYQNNFHVQGQLLSIRNASENWKRIWEMYELLYVQGRRHNPLSSIDLSASNMWRRIGFMKHASEYWLLASLQLDRLCAAEQLVESDPTAPLLQQYDQTSMQQVNDLIADFQKTTIT